jgi:hypothetical protein
MKQFLSDTPDSSTPIQDVVQFQSWQSPQSTPGGIEGTRALKGRAGRLPIVTCKQGSTVNFYSLLPFQYCMAKLLLWWANPVQHTYDNSQFNRSPSAGIEQAQVNKVPRRRISPRPGNASVGPDHGCWHDTSAARHNDPARYERKCAREADGP